MRNALPAAAFGAALAAAACALTTDFSKYDTREDCPQKAPLANKQQAEAACQELKAAGNCYNPETIIIACTNGVQTKCGALGVLDNAFSADAGAVTCSMGYPEAGADAKKD